MKIKLLNEKKAAKYLGVSQSTLNKARNNALTPGKYPMTTMMAPTFIRMGNTIRYDVEDLKAWLEINKVRPEENCPTAQLDMPLVK